MNTTAARRSPRPVRLAACLLAAVTAAWAGACGEGATTLAGPTAQKCQISVTAFTRAFGAAGGPGSVTLATARECSWSAASATQWISFPKQASGQGPASFGFAVAANPAPRAREGTIEVSGQRLGISQEAAPCRFDLDSGTTRAGAPGGRASVRVS
ncbi:MAG TPA: BACON domain-containing protein, partial [Vicinamibacterales bacterium]|nr:BACON domain-containing protein [Vicinamibacterales bacterium]